LCSSRKYPYPSRGRLTGIPRGRGWGVQKHISFKGKNEAKLKFPDGWGSSHRKTLCGRGIDFSRNTFTDLISWISKKRARLISENRQHLQSTAVSDICEADNVHYGYDPCSKHLPLMLVVV